MPRYSVTLSGWHATMSPAANVQKTAAVALCMSDICAGLSSVSVCVCVLALLFISLLQTHRRSATSATGQFRPLHGPIGSPSLSLALSPCVSMSLCLCLHWVICYAHPYGQPIQLPLPQRAVSRPSLLPFRAAEFGTEPLERLDTLAHHFPRCVSRGVHRLGLLVATL